jgi:hypothetical protein
MALTQRIAPQPNGLLAADFLQIPRNAADALQSSTIDCAVL